MSSSKIAAVAIAALFVSGSAFAQTQSPPQTQTSAPQKPTSQTQSTTPPAKSQTNSDEKNEKAATQTFTGCVMTEPDYRQAHNLGKGALGGAGLGDEYVLVDVKTSPETANSPAASDTTLPPASSDKTGSMGKCADQGTAYRLTGTQEKKIKGLVGQEIEVRGRFKHADDVIAAGGTRPDEKLPAEVEIVSFHAVGQAATMTQPAPAPRTAVTSAAPRPQSETPSPQTPAQPATPKSELPHTASSTPLLAAIGLLALSSGFALSLRRRRAV